MPDPLRPPLVVIAGATATGKTVLSIRLAEALAAEGVAAEIVSADSRQVYRGLDIGTAKVSAADRARVPHHGLDLVDPDRPLSVADWAAATGSSLGGIAARGAVALLVGGTGLYLRAIGRGIALDDLPHDPDLRARLEADLAADGPAAQAERLRALAPTLASRVDLRNPRRALRALELALLRGDGPLPEARGYGGPAVWLGLALDPAVNRRWIARRAEEQFAAGLVQEARALRERFDPGLPAFSAIGYHEAWSVLDGNLSLEAAIDVDARRNAAFARRQRTWFRGEPGIEWLDADAEPFPIALEWVRRFLGSLEA